MLLPPFLTPWESEVRHPAARARTPDKLIARQTRGVELDVCRGCGGLFLDPSELETLRADARREALSERLENAVGLGDELVSGLPEDTAWDLLVVAIRGLLGRV